MVKNSVVGPHVSIGDHSFVSDSRIENSIIQTNSEILKAQIANSMVGNYVTYQGSPKDLSIGDFNKVIE